MSTKRTILAADLFCGAGGTSQGLLMAANKINADLELLAINHWSVAIDTHSLNHPEATSLCTGVDVVDPLKLVPGGRLDVLCASPECTHHSVARGGKPMNDQSRASAWHILRWAQVLYIDSLIIENVPEFQSWGPLGANGRPMKSKRGALFQQFIESLKALGYRVEYRVLNCADYGDPTTRRRLFVIARRGNKQISWPEPTHIPASQLRTVGLFKETRKAWRSAREIIDWTLPSKSIFERKRPLADKTLLRIQAGMKKFCGMDVDLKKCFAEDLRPFLVVLRGTGTSASVDDPLQTVTANGNHYGLVEPFMMATDQTGRANAAVRSADSPVATLVTKANQAVIEPFLLPHPRENDQPHSVDRPLRTVTSSSCDLSLCEPFIVPQFGGADPRSVNRPLGTLTTTSRGVGLVEPFITTAGGAEGQGRRPQSLRETLGTVLTNDRRVLVEPFILGQQSCSAPRSVDDAVPTIATAGAVSLTQPFLTHYRGDHAGKEDGAKRSSGLDSPLPTQDTSNRFGLAEPFMVTVNHGEGETTRRANSVDDPMRTTTSKIGEGICEPFLIAYYGTQNMSETGEPLPTVTSHDRFGLVEAEVTHYRLDIRFRMLQPRELARAQGFPDSYEFTGNREAVVKQIGNAVPPNTAMALISGVLA